MNPRNSLTIGHVAGIPVRIHFTWLFAAVYLAVVFAGQFAGLARAANVADAELLPPWAWGILLMLGLFAGVLLHEFGHVFVARRGGIKVRSVTLMMLGGISEIGPVDRPRLEWVMAAAGPAVSLVLALALYLGYRASAHAAPDVKFGLFYLAQINFVIGLFNLLPAFPMDGGRVLRSALVPHFGAVRATRIAAGVGKGFGVLLLLVGITGGNLWLLLIGAFLLIGGDAESRATEATAAMRGLRVGDLFVRRVATIDRGATVGEAAAVLLAERADACVVTDGEKDEGLITRAMVAAVPVRRRVETPVASAMAPARFVDAADDLGAAMRALDDLGLDAIPVRDGARLVGSLGREDIARGLQLRALGTAPTDPPPSR